MKLNNLLLLKSMGMLLCRPDCASGIPQIDWGSKCQTTPKSGGISRLIFLVCDPEYHLLDPAKGWCDLANIQQAIADGKFLFSGEIVGQKPKGSFAKKRLSSCAPEQKISGTQTITFQDFNNIDALENEYDFWDAIQKKQAFLSLGYLTCDDKFYQVSNQFDIEVGDVIEDSKDGVAYFDGTVTFQGLDIVKPCLVAGLNDALRNYVPSGYSGT